ncbi:MAG: hypothetical protein AUG81_12650 [Verrucomicrobia bacterium 13_1_20CM_4_54_11]|nr:MAG: hypothetical protein AUG81_12650 [Verrucomicrobia bacterium 13_1_20CM_4_54_11]
MITNKKMVLMCDNKKFEIDRNFFSDLRSVLSKLNDDYYNFAFYFYIESDKQINLNVFTYDSLNKNYLTEIKANSGYTIASSINIKLQEKREDYLELIGYDLWNSVKLFYDSNTNFNTI